MTDLISAIWESLTPMNIVLGLLCFYLIRRLLSPQPTLPHDLKQEQPEKPRMTPRDFTVQELLQFDGSDPEKPICLAVKGKVYDVSRGRDFYGPGGAYGVFAGHDATRGLANWIADKTQVKDEYDPCSDLTEVQWMQVNDWESHFMTKYDYVGKLLTPEEAVNRKTDGPSLEERKELFKKVEALVKEADELAVKELEKEEQKKDKVQ
jgi:membrane-associated progesterone receptor component